MKSNTRLEVYKLIEMNKDSKEIASILNISLRTAQTYMKEYKDTQNANANKVQTQSEKKKRKEFAKAKIIAGHSLKEVSEQTRTHISSLKKLSSKENLQQSQLEFLKSLRESKIKEIEDNKLKRLEINNDNLKVIKREIEIGIFNKNLQSALLENEKTEQEILELSRIERLEKFEFDKKLYQDKRLLTITEELVNLSDKDIEKILEIIEESKRVNEDG